MPDGADLFSVRVYYEDTDFSGVVYHANYLRYLERGRTEFLRRHGIVQADLRDQESGEPIAFIVRRLAIDFVRPARMDDLLTVETHVVELGGASLTLDQRVLRKAEVLVTAKVRIGLVGGGKARRLPVILRDRLA